MARITSSIAFYCRKSKEDRNGLAPIEVSIIISGKRVFINLPRKERPDEFNKALSTKRSNDIKDYLEEVRTKFNNYQTELLRNDIPITPAMLKSCFKNGGIRSYTIGDMFNDFLSIQSKRTDLSLGSYKRYEYVRNLFLTKYNKDKELETLTCSDIDAFYIYLQSRYNTATSASHMTRLKTIITYAINDGRLRINPFKNIKVKHSHKKIEYLTEEELGKIVNAQFSSKSLEDVRDAFVFQAATGLAYIDLLSLQRDDIKTDGEHYYITKTRQKTGTEYTTVVLPEGVEVLKRRNYDLHILSNQKYNAYLKAIADIAGINKTLTTHIARKTFCCRLLNKGVSINTVAKCAGHQDIKITRSYYATLQESTVIKEVSEAFR